jgi:N-acetylneuraminic acid mutarotase
MVKGTLSASLRPEAVTKVSKRTLTFEERVAYQRAIEELYWRYRIWPKENAGPKPPLDAVMSQAQLEKKVADYLRNSQAVADQWQQPLTAEQLQAEMDRMAKNTRQPEVLREVFEALGNDPFVVAECLAKPALAERLLAHSAGAQVKQTSRPYSHIVAGTTNYTLPTISDAAAGCIDDTWTATSTTNAPSGRINHTAVWTGSEMIVWGGSGAGGRFSTGGRYNPSTDSWTDTSTANPPVGRELHTAVWTGSEMIVWGGFSGPAYFNTGARYNPTTDTWTATSTSSAPSARVVHTAVWSGSEMIVWGGRDFNNLFNTGGRYNPGTDSWTATSTINGPLARVGHTAVWTSSEMIVWGGVASGNTFFNTGGRYTPSTDSWMTTSVINAPTARSGHKAVWTGNEIIIWGGGFYDGTNHYLNTGGKYDPGTDSWIATTTTNAPSARSLHAAVWTGNEMVIWGGADDVSAFNTGGRYNIGMDNWIPTTTTNAPAGRPQHTAVWTGSEMIVWGGYDGGYLSTGGRYCAPTGPTSTPTPTATATATFTPTSTATATATATPTPTATPRVTPTPRLNPTPRSRPTPPPRP